MWTSLISSDHTVAIGSRDWDVFRKKHLFSVYYFNHFCAHLQVCLFHVDIKSRPGLDLLPDATSFGPEIFINHLMMSIFKRIPEPPDTKERLVSLILLHVLTHVPGVFPCIHSNYFTNRADDVYSMITRFDFSLIWSHYMMPNAVPLKLVFIKRVQLVRWNPSGRASSLQWIRIACCSSETWINYTVSSLCVG